MLKEQDILHFRPMLIEYKIFFGKTFDKPKIFQHLIYTFV